MPLVLSCHADNDEKKNSWDCQLVRSSFHSAKMSFQFQLWGGAWGSKIYGGVLNYIQLYNNTVTFTCAAFFFGGYRLSVCS